MSRRDFFRRDKNVGFRNEPVDSVSFSSTTNPILDARVERGDGVNIMDDCREEKNTACF